MCICIYCVDARSCSLREAINVDAFQEHVSSLHADGDYLLSQEYEVKLFDCSHENVHVCSVLYDDVKTVHLEAKVMLFMCIFLINRK